MTRPIWVNYYISSFYFIIMGKLFAYMKSLPYLCSELDDM